MLIEHGLIDGQVLQRGANQTATALVRGQSAGTGPVLATIRLASGQLLRGWNQRPVGQARAGRFTATLRGLPVGGPYQIELRVGTESITAQRIQVGDVWLLAGQSNMEGCGLLDGAPEPHPLVHAQYMDHRWDLAREPMNFTAESTDQVHWSRSAPQRPTPAKLRQIRREKIQGVGPGLFFAREMVQRSGGVPQGLLPCAHGGTTMEQWDPAKKHLGEQSLYGSLLRAWQRTGQPVAGLLWYQGESEANPDGAKVYVPRMKKLVAAFRRDLRQPELPVLLVQIGRVYGRVFHVQGWNMIQRLQLQLPRRIRRCAVVSAIDLPLDDMIHIGTAGQTRLGVRLARLADRLVYRNPRELPPPELASIRLRPSARALKLRSHELVVRFRNVQGGLRADGVPCGFALIDAQGHNTDLIFKTTLRGNAVHLEICRTEPLNSLRLAYGYGTCPHVNITDQRDMPIPAFGPLPIG